MQKDKLMIIDGNSILNRAFFGLQGAQLLRTSDGLYTNAVFGFINILYKFLEEEQPDSLCVAFDLKAPTFRHKEFDGYKAQRKGMPPELAVQMPVIKEVLDAMNIKRLEYEGFEADDIIGSVSLCAETKGMQVIIITGDRDSLQLTTDTTRVKLPTTRGGKTDTEEYDKNRMLERYGVTPLQFIDVKGLMGDSSDNIPGVPGIGEKTALDLIIRFGSIEHLYDSIEEVEKKSVKEKLLANRELAFLSKRLATIERNMPELCTLDELKRKDFDREKLYELFKRLEFRSFLDKFNLAAPEAPGVDFEGRIEIVRGKEGMLSLREALRAENDFAFFHLLDREEGFKSSLAGIAFTLGENTAYYVDISHSDGEEEFLEIFRDIFENPGIKKYGHDVKGLLVHWKKKGVHLKALGFDTMIGAYIVNPSRDTYMVSELAGEYLKKTVPSVEQLAGKGKSAVHYRDMDVERISEAAGMYALIVRELTQLLDASIRENDQAELYHEIELPLVEVLADMEYWGFKVNVEELRSFALELESKIDILAGDIYSLAGEEFNINSPKQLGVILFEKLQLPVLKKTKTGYSTDAEVLDQLADRHEIVSRILEYRQLVKLKSTYTEGLISVIHADTGKIHSSFNQTVTVTGRISSTEPNLQNIPVKLEMGRKIRRVFVPSSEEYLLSAADYSQIELRVLAHITNDENMIEAFMNKEDIHTATASKVFGIPMESVTSLMRSRAKAVNFGIVYGIGDFSLAKDLGTTRKEARKYIDEYLNRYSKVKQYMHDTVETGKEKGYVTTLFHRRRYLPELQSSNFNIKSFGERIAMNTPIQGSAADIIKIAMVKVYRELTERNLKSRMILQVHDELIIETHRDEKDEVAQILKDCMENATRLSVPLSVEVKTGSSWYETK
jgi:DNA polymerase I